MDSQVYLMLLRDFGSMPTSQASAMVKLPMMLTALIQGDSLDVPYMRFIKVQSVSHKIGEVESNYQLGYQAAKTASQTDYADLRKSLLAHEKKVSDAVGKKAKAKAYMSPSHVMPSLKSMFHTNPKRFSGSSFLGANQGGIKAHLPQHGCVEFSKNLDGATPQLAYGCSAQELFGYAIFFWQRRTGFNISSVRFPYMVMGLKDIMIRQWQLSDDLETVELSYDKICWGAYSQAADTPLPMPESTRFWSTSDCTGGQLLSKFMGFVAAVTVVLFAAGSVAVSAAVATNKSGTGVAGTGGLSY